MNSSKIPSCLTLTASSRPSNESSALIRFGHSFAGVHGYLSLAVCFFGISNNLANIVVLTRREMAISATNFLLLSLAVVDLLTMLVYAPCLYHFDIVRKVDHSPHYAWVLYQNVSVSCTIILHSTAIWLTVSLAVFRYIYVGFPSVGSQFATKYWAKLSTVLISLGCILLTTPNILVNHVTPCEHSTNNDTISHEDKRHSVTEHRRHYLISSEISDPLAAAWWRTETLKVTNIWLQAICFKIVPSVLLSVLTVLLIYELRSALNRRRVLQNTKRKKSAQLLLHIKLSEDRGKQNAENWTTALLITILVSFLVVEVPQGILVICLHLINGFFVEVYKPLGDFIDFMTLINHSINFVIYTTMSLQFRKTFCRVFCLSRNENQSTTNRQNTTT